MREDQLDPKWIWQVYIEKICLRLNYNPDRVYKMNFIEFANWLSYFKEREDVEKKLAERNSNTKSL